ncbi:MAG: hypothetical protein L0241_11765 [Planctomycetia bacterium]|nr:hypothetical protein [Planctomycetia bacterium]
MSATRFLAFVAVGLVALLTSPILADPPKQKEPPKSDTPPIPDEATIMKAKLKHSQVLLEALTREDYKKLNEEANALVRISDLETFLRAYKTEKYRIHAATFKESAELLAAKAKEKNLDGATVAYTDMTLSCVKCHNYIRGRKRD